MRIVVATTTGFHLRRLAVELIRHGHDVTFMSYLPRRKTRQYGLADRHTVSLFITLQPASLLSLWRGSNRLLTRLRESLLVRTDRAVARRLPPCDVFIGLSSMAVESARAARERYGARVLIERGSSHVAAQARLTNQGSFMSPRYIERELASYAVADRVIVPSRFAERTFLEEGFPAERLHVAVLGVDGVRFSPSPTPPALPVRLLFIGQWSHRKGADLLAAALDRLPALQITHVGLPVDVPLPTNTRFRSLGYLNHEALNKCMAEHHLLVLPSREDGFGMVMTEALAAGLRVIASDASGGPDLAAVLGARDVTVVQAGSLDSLVDAIAAQTAAIEADPAGFRPRAEAVEQLSWTHYGDRYNGFLRELMDAPR